MAQEIVGKIHKTLIKRKKTIAAAESLTGGLLSSLLTKLSGSSKYFLLGAVTYSNSAKTRILKVPAGVIAKKGAVSREVAEYMAKAVRKIARADYALSTTGIAGPTNTTADMPLGTVFIAVVDKRACLCRKYCFRGSREKVRIKSSLKALEMLNAFLHRH